MKNNILAFPDRIVIELTPQCNLSCSMCPRHYIDETDGFMSETLWKKLVDEVAGNAPETIILPFWRGESPLHPRFIPLIQYALDKGLRVHLSTNGILVKGEMASILAQCEYITFSIHNALGFENAKKFLAQRDEVTPIVQVSFVSGESTETILKEMIKDSQLNGFESVRLYEEHTKDGIFGNSGNEMKEQRTFCPKLEGTFVAAYDGTISRCNHIWVTENEIDLKFSSIQEAWNSFRLNDIRRKYPDEKCEPCDQWTGHTNGQTWRMVDGKVVHTIFHPEHRK